MLNVHRRGLHQHLFLTQVTAQNADFFGRTKSLSQQTIGVQFLHPLAVQDITLATGDILDPPGIDQINLEAPLFENFIERDPIDAGRFHRYGGDAALLQPISNGLQVDRKRSKLPYRHRVPPFRYGHQVSIRANVDTGSVDVDVLQVRRQI